MSPRSLYIHVPFCTRRCGYCDFAVEAMREPPVEAWLNAIVTEMALTAAVQGWTAPLRLETLYIGGGTPSLLGPGVMSRLLERLRPHAVLEGGAEWTCEANPESFDHRLAADWHAAGVNRISLGVQSFAAETLRWMGRLHGPEGPARAVGAAREVGIEDVSLDLIFGVPDHLRRDWAADLRMAVELAPSHVSLYGLTAEAGAPLGRRVQEGREVLADEDRYAAEYLLAHEVLVGAGYEHYEVSNFARGGHRSRHNGAYWTGAPYAALGPGSHAYHPPVRQWNLRSWAAYEEALRAGRLPLDGEERLDAETERLERVWLGLRTSRGLRLDDVTGRQVALVQKWAAAGLVTLGEGEVRATARGWLLLDEMAVEFHEAGGVAGARRAGTDAPKRESIDGRPPLVQISANSNPSS